MSKNPIIALVQFNIFFRERERAKVRERETQSESERGKERWVENKEQILAIFSNALM